MLKHRQYKYFYIFSRTTLNETLTAKYDGVLPRTPYVRPKSEIYTPKRDDEHPHPFRMPPLPENACPKMLLIDDWNAKIVIESDLSANVRFFALMNVSSRCWSPFQANECAFSCNEQQKVAIYSLSFCVSYPSDIIDLSLGHGLMLVFTWRH